MIETQRLSRNVNFFCCRISQERGKNERAHVYCTVCSVTAKSRSGWDEHWEVYELLFNLHSKQYRHQIKKWVHGASWVTCIAVMHPFCCRCEKCGDTLSMIAVKTWKEKHQQRKDTLLLPADKMSRTSGTFGPYLPVISYAALGISFFHFILVIVYLKLSAFISLLRLCWTPPQKPILTLKRERKKDS